MPSEPTTNGVVQPTFGGEDLFCGEPVLLVCGDAVVTKINAEGSALVYSTYLGGIDVDFPFAIAVDASGNAYVTGETRSTNFPTTPGAFDTFCGTDAAGNCNPDTTGGAVSASSVLNL